MVNVVSDSTRIPCSACDGRGNIEMPPELRETLERLRKAPATAGILAKAFSVEHTAMLNRLERLRGLGFVRRHRLDWRTWRYEATR